MGCTICKEGNNEGYILGAKNELSNTLSYIKSSESQSSSGHTSPKQR